MDNIIIDWFPTILVQFKDRSDAALKLSKLLNWIKNENPVILAIPRGGVILADIIASELQGTLDIILSKKVGAPNNPELAIGALTHDGSYFPNQEITRFLKISHEYIISEKKKLLKELQRQIMNFRGTMEYDLENKTVVLVDDGIATGATLLVAIQWIKKQKPKKIVVATPVGPGETIEKLSYYVDQVIVLHSPLSFNSVGEFYREFDQVDDKLVQKIMLKHGFKIKPQISDL